MSGHRSVLDAMRLDGRVAVVTGAGSGIGQATAIALAEAGAAVVCADLDGERADGTASGISDAGGVAEGVRLDVVDATAVRAVAEVTAHRHGSLDVWVNVAGMPYEGAFADVTEADLDRVFAVNVKGTFFGCQAAAAIMVPAGRGSIVNTTSGAVDSPTPGIAPYAMSKAAVVQLTKQLATEVGPSGVRVNAVAPGFIATAMTARFWTREDGTADEELRAAVTRPITRGTPLRRIGDPWDIAGAMLFLASDASAYLTGQVIRPNGGTAMV